MQVEGTQGATGLTLGWTLPRGCRQLALCVGPQRRTSPSAVDGRCQPPQGSHPLTHGGGREKRWWETPAAETSSQWGNGIGQVRKPAKSKQESGKQSRGGRGEPGMPGTPPDPLGQINEERHRILPVLDQSVTSDGLSECILGDCLKRYIARRPSKHLPPSLLPAAARSDFHDSGDPQEPELGI